MFANFIIIVLDLDVTDAVPSRIVFESRQYMLARHPHHDGDNDSSEAI